ncbi:cysteine-rich receptor-like protein kinase 25 [Eucalyptus grandis]|uniref:cysteine-rich receptor-like protein kinase 25 n=1 Tax=Eucalyptus grandis TaxID=71139 RepID=UPI00192E78BA|nr:cysteine-rich receptor-like protein kinase 25 [Eucalyptus grandis]
MNSCYTICLSLSLSLSLSSSSFFFVFVQNFGTAAAASYLNFFCPRNSLFTPNSTYESKLNTLLSSLSSAATNSTYGFANATAGQTPPDRAYGLFLCRGDVSNSTCNECVATAKQRILRRCPNQRLSVIWYDECMLRHDNSSFFSAMDLRPALMVQHSGNITDPTALAQVLAKTLDKIATRASNGTGKKFAVEEVIMTSLRRLYTLAQCTPDLTALDCNSCLRAMISNLPKGRKGGRSFTLSCSVRFEEYPFYNAPAPPPSYLPPSPAPTSAAPEIRPKGKSNKFTVIIIAVTIPLGSVMVLLSLICCVLRRKGKKMFEVIKGKNGAKELTAVESLQFDLATIQAATNYFSHENKLGEGGFGEVFQGRLPNGQQVAVKRLSQRSKQGDGEFKNEILLVAKLQHINLVRLLGFCLEGEEKLLVYEFVPNKSLDYFLFDPQKRRQLDWPLRYKIIFGIARGMLYLHEDSRLRIIHRDLKCSNILLDSEINPKISDFGMARIFGVNQTQASTNKFY